MLLFGLAMWAANRFVPLLTLFPDPWRRLGVGLMLIAPIAPVTALIQFRRARTTVNPIAIDTASALVTDGIYTWTRNPMYLGLALLLAGWAIHLASLSAAFGPPIFVVLIQQFQIRPEEQALRAKFGDEYDRYARRVGRWFGRGAA
ncbi:MAG TPA: isoprenylcysteine carboxylmethyltransferase family protein [Solirubrobacteraceae bacterium]|nr:isoprenylcysteine carboxylmethyltransferase family protein [Solirubrobacteraceae bacterium]